MGNGKASNPSWHKWRRNRSTSDTKPSYARPISRRKPWLFFSRCSWEKDLATIRGTDICGRPLSPYQFVRRFSSVERKGMREEEIENAKCRVEECRNHPRVDSESTLRIRGVRPSDHVLPDDIPYLYQMPFETLPHTNVYLRPAKRDNRRGMKEWRQREKKGNSWYNVKQSMNEIAEEMLGLQYLTVQQRLRSSHDKLCRINCRFYERAE